MLLIVKTVKTLLYLLHENFNPSQSALISQKLNTIIGCEILTSNMEIYHEKREKVRNKISSSMFSTNICMSSLDVKVNSRWILLLAREPLKHSNADLSNAKDTLVLSQDMVVAQLSPFFVASNSGSLLWYRLHSTAIPPVVLKTNGVNVACSSSRTRLAYWRFFSVSCCL